MKQRRHKRKRIFLLLLLLVIASSVAGVLVWHNRPIKLEVPKVITDVTKPITAPPVATPPAPSFNKNQFSLTDPTSLWVIVNKQRQLPDGYAPGDLVTPDVTLRLAAGNSEMKMRQEPASALKALIAGANAAGYKLLLASGYRSQASQKALHDSYVTRDGIASADASSARAGFSEHQTGLAVDVGRTDHKCEVDACFADTPEAKWLATNAYQYGFIVRYQQGKQPITGYVYEPWHLRYVGKDLAKAVYDSGQTLEEFFGLPAAPDYK